MTSTTIEVTHLEEITGAFEISCDYADESWSCPDQPARWVMHIKPCCPAIPLHKLACDQCKEARLMDAFSIECPDCGHITEHAPDAYRYIEPLRGKA